MERACHIAACLEVKIVTDSPKIEHREIQTRGYRVGSKLVESKQQHHGGDGSNQNVQRILGKRPNLAIP